jgi:cobalamin biosynthesis protein CbiG
MPYRVVDGDPKITLDVEAVEKRVATFLKGQGISDDAGWAAAVSTAFNAANAPGLSAATRTFLSEFFTKLIKIN